LRELDFTLRESLFPTPADALHPQVVARRRTIFLLSQFLRRGHWLKDLPHSKHDAFNRDVINPQDGHILCVPYPAICGFSLRIL